MNGQVWLLDDKCKIETLKEGVKFSLCPNTVLFITVTVILIKKDVTDPVCNIYGRNTKCKHNIPYSVQFSALKCTGLTPAENSVKSLTICCMTFHTFNFPCFLQFSFPVLCSNK